MPAKVGVDRHEGTHTEFIVDCAECGIAPMLGLTYDGAIALANTHNSEHHLDVPKIPRWAGDC